MKEKVEEAKVFFFSSLPGSMRGWREKEKVRNQSSGVARTRKAPRQELLKNIKKSLKCTKAKTNVTTRFHPTYTHSHLHQQIYGMGGGWGWCTKQKLSVTANSSCQKQNKKTIIYLLILICFKQILSWYRPAVLVSNMCREYLLFLCIDFVRILSRGIFKCHSLFLFSIKWGKKDTR